MKSIIELARQAGFITDFGCRETASNELLTRFAALVRAEDEALMRQALDTLTYWLEYGETPGSHDMIQRTHDVLQERLK